MTATEADRRIIKSRQTLSRYIQMTNAGVDVMPGTMMLVHDEIAILEGLSVEHPRKVAKLILLAGEWVGFQARLKAKMH